MIGSKVRPTNLVQDLKKDNLLGIVLQGLTAVLSRELDLKNLRLTMTDEAKRDIHLDATKNDLGDDTKNQPVTLPYGYLMVSEIAPEKGRIPFKNIKRMGLTMGLSDVTSATSQKAYLFPVNLSLELHYFVASAEDALYTAAAMALLSGASAFNFDIQLSPPQGIRFNNRLGFIDNLSIPITEVNTPATAGASEIVMPMVLETFIGFIRDVAAVNGDTPTVTSFSVATGTGPDEIRSTHLVERIDR